METIVHPVFLVLTAPSGAGKSTLIKLLREKYAEFDYSVSCTTRAPRGEEKDGVAYHFITDDEFNRRVAAGEFLEHALVHDHQYGTLKAAIEGPMSRGRCVLMDIDVAGAAQVRDIAMKLPEDNPIRRGFLDVFIDVPSMEELSRRLYKRGEDTPEVIEKRLKNAAGERARKDEFMKYIVNDKLEDAFAQLCACVLEASK